MQTPSAIPDYIETVFARQPVFDAKQRVWGYELLYRQKFGDNSAVYSDADIATLCVISNSMLNLASSGESAEKAIIHFTTESILREAPLSLPSQATLVLIDEEAVPSAELMEALNKLKAQNYSLGLNNFSGKPSAKPLLALCDMVMVRFPDKDRAGLEKILQLLPPNCKQRCAKMVENQKQFELAKELGFTLFQGFFFQRPEIVPGKKIPASVISKLSLYRLVTQEDPDTDELIRVLQADVSLSYRFLRYVNSASFGFNKVDSIRHALMLLGWKRVKSWFWLMLLTDIQPRNKSSELPFLSALRGRFMQLCAAGRPDVGVGSDALFLLGLFSLLDAILDAPMQELASSLPLDEKIKQALCGVQNECWPWLEVARCFEDGDWDKLDGLTDKLKLNPIKVAADYCKAAEWTRSFFSANKVSDSGK